MQLSRQELEPPSLHSMNRTPQVTAFFNFFPLAVQAKRRARLFVSFILLAFGNHRQRSLDNSS